MLTLQQPAEIATRKDIEATVTTAATGVETPLTEIC